MNAIGTITTRTQVPKSNSLESGDLLNSEEFFRRYTQRPDIKKAELIEGVVYVASPVRLEGHGTEHGYAITWLGTYAGYTPGTRLGDNSTVRLDPDNVPQPDGLLMIEGGQAILENRYLVGAPELALEVAASSLSLDLNTKFKVYSRNGVREYVIWRTEDAAIDWFVLRGSQYEQLEPRPDGIHASEVFPGLWLDAAALIRLDIPRVLAVLQQGLATKEHADFVAKLITPT